MKRIPIALKQNYEETSKPFIKIFGIFSSINFPVFYLVWNYISNEPYTDFYMRLVAFLLVFPLIFHEKWPQKAQDILPIYWYVTLLYCLPFLITYMFILNQASIAWATNVMIGIIWLILLVDWISFFVLLILGVLSGCLVYFIQFGNLHIDSPHLTTLYINYAFIILTAAAFSFRKGKRLKMIRLLRAAGGSIAHEMRTPLASVRLNGESIEIITDQLKQLIPNTNPKLDAKIEQELLELRSVSNDIVLFSRRSNHLINLLLSNLKEDFDTFDREDILVKEILETAIDEFVFQQHEKQKLHINIQDNFVFEGNKELFKHILFNLIKNSLYFIQASGKGDIYIEAKTLDQHHILTFKDTGPGIPHDQIPFLFKPFYSKRPHGTGLGLSFCKKAMNSIGGDITVESVFGEHTTFTLSFPKN